MRFVIVLMVLSLLVIVGCGGASVAPGPATDVSSSDGMMEDPAAAAPDDDS